MRTKIWAIGLMVMTTALTSSAQIFYKLGANRLEFDILALLTNYHIAIGICLYAIGSVLMITAFKGGELSVLYPIIATSYIWVGLISWYWFSESLDLLRWSGIIFIFFGVMLVGIGSRRLHNKLEGAPL